uniref:ATP synthase subunit 8 n=1 Tax=Megalurothrips distalis TaxID=1030663 RepID=UPI0030E2701B
MNQKFEKNYQNFTNKFIYQVLFLSFSLLSILSLTMFLMNSSKSKKSFSKKSKLE